MNRDERAKVLTRFGADPKKVRVSIRRVEGTHSSWWVATVASRSDSKQIVSVPCSVSPEKAVCNALRDAEGFVEGVDTSLSWAYEHPWGVEGVAKNDFSPCPYYDHCNVCGFQWEDHNDDGSCIDDDE